MKHYRIKRVPDQNSCTEYSISYMPQRRRRFLIFWYWEDMAYRKQSFENARKIIDLEMSHGFMDSDIIYHERPNNAAKE